MIKRIDKCEICGHIVYLDVCCNENDCSCHLALCGYECAKKFDEINNTNLVPKLCEEV